MADIIENPKLMTIWSGKKMHLKDSSHSYNSYIGLTTGYWIPIHSVIKSGCKRIYNAEKAFMYFTIIILNSSFMEEFSIMPRLPLEKGFEVTGVPDPVRCIKLA